MLIRLAYLLAEELRSPVQQKLNNAKQNNVPGATSGGVSAQAGREHPGRPPAAPGLLQSLLHCLKRHRLPSQAPGPGRKESVQCMRLGPRLPSATGTRLSGSHVFLLLFPVC